MDIIRLILVMIFGALVNGALVKDAIKSFKDGKYFWIGTDITMAVIIIAVVIDYVLYQAFIY